MEELSIGRVKGGQGGTSLSTAHWQALEKSLALQPGTSASSIHKNNFMVAADGCRGEFAQCLIHEGTLANYSGSLARPWWLKGTTLTHGDVCLQVIPAACA